MYRDNCFLIIAFILYSFCGWLWESLILPLLSGKRIHNSGFLRGPYVPIYGVGAIVVFLLFSSSEKWYSIFIEGAVVACLLEYITSWAMEKIFHRRWWDYSRMKFNLNGRICLAGFLLFGLFSVVSVKFSNGIIYDELTNIELIPLIVLSTVFLTIFILDFTMTSIEMLKLRDHIEEVTERLRIEAEKLQVELEERGFTREKLFELMEKKKEGLPTIDGHTYKRLLEAFPNLLNRKP